MNKLRKSILGGLLAFGWMLLWGSGGAVSAPVKAASKLVIYVDDLPDNNGSVRCPATDVHSLDDVMSRLGMNLMNITIYVCPGEYIPLGDALYFNNFTNLKIIGKGSPVIRPLIGFNDSVFYVSSSTNVTIQGFAIDGGGWLDPAAVAAIRFEDTSGVITGNTISGWHRTYSGSPPFDVGVTNPMHSIWLSGNGFSTKKVQISNNTVYDSQDTGILVTHLPAPVKIAKNRIAFGSGIVPAFAPAANIRMQAGIALVNSGPGSTISGNEVTSDSDMFPMAPAFARGILVYGTPGAKVTGNIVRGTAMQISIENWCNLVGVSASNNVISGNKLYDSWFIGIRVTARNDTVTPGVFDCQTTPHADSIKISGNKIYNTTFSGPLSHWGVYLETVGGLISNVSIKGNTFGGFSGSGPNPDTVHYNNQNGIPGAVLGPNKIMPAPPAGVYK